MKKILVNAIITIDDDSDICAENFNEHLKSLGSVAFISQTSVIEYASEDELEETDSEVIVMVSADDSEPLFLCDEMEEISENPLPDELVALVENGICTAIAIRHPRADRYGTPLAATDDAYAADIASCYVAKISPEMNVSVEDSNDDSGQLIWLKIRFSK